MNTLINFVGNPKLMLQVLIALAVLATAFSVLGPMLSGDNLQKRMKAVAVERERLRGAARDQFNARTGGNRLRQAPKPFMKRIVDDFNLTKWLGTETSKMQLLRAGYRGPQAEIAFLFFRLVMPPVFMGLAIFYVIVVKLVDVTALTGVASFCTPAPRATVQVAPSAQALTGATAGELMRTAE